MQSFELFCCFALVNQVFGNAKYNTAPLLNIMAYYRRKSMKGVVEETQRGDDGCLRSWILFSHISMEHNHQDTSAPILQGSSQKKPKKLFLRWLTNKPSENRLIKKKNKQLFQIFKTLFPISPQFSKHFSMRFQIIKTDLSQFPLNMAIILQYNSKYSTIMNSKLFSGRLTNK